MSKRADRPDETKPHGHSGVLPRKPASIDPQAERILTELSRLPESAEIVLGGYFALQHYSDYRRTHDIDAWWRSRASSKVEHQIRKVMRNVAAADGSELGERRFGETVSFELSRQGRKYFSFQIAVRSVELEPPILSAWPPILIESLADNIGAKMNALVERGSPRDFSDIRQVVAAGLITTEECWELWRRKNPGRTVDEAKRTASHHLASLERRRPLESILDDQARRTAAAAREWMKRELLRHS